MDTALFITDGGRFHCTAANWRGNGSWNGQAKVYAPVAGRAWVALEERRTPLAAGGLYLIPPHHRLDYAAEPDMTVNWLHFIPASPLVDARLAGFDSVYCFDAAVAHRWLPVTRRCADFLAAPSPGLTFRLQAMVSDLVGLVLDNTPEEAPDKRLLPALRYMDDHVMKPVTLAEIAVCAGLSPEHFHRLFRAQFRTTPFSFLLQRRMARARQLLAGGSLSVKEVAAQCGYEDPYYFSRVFRRHFGCTPRDVRSGKAQPLP